MNLDAYITVPLVGGPWDDYDRTVHTGSTAVAIPSPDAGLYHCYKASPLTGEFLYMGMYAGSDLPR